MFWRCAKNLAIIWHKYQRILNLPKNHSFFIFGARGVGKFALLQQQFTSDEAVFINLLDPQLAGELSAYPNRLLERIGPYQGRKRWVVIDEVQKVPALLEIVHQQLSQKKSILH